MFDTPYGVFRDNCKEMSEDKLRGLKSTLQGINYGSIVADNRAKNFVKIINEELKRRKTEDRA